MADTLDTLTADSTIRGSTPGAQLRERNSEIEDLRNAAVVQKKRDSFVDFEEEQRRRRSDVSISSQSSSRRGSRHVTIEESPQPPKSQPRAGANIVFLEDGLNASHDSTSDSDPLLDLSNTYKITLERDPPPLDTEFEGEEDEYDPSLGVHFYIPPPTSAFEDQSNLDFLSHFSGSSRQLPNNGESDADTNTSMLIIRSLSPLSSGKSSPAQRCGMLNKGDVVLRINEEKVWGRGVMELGEIITRQMSWKEGGDNSSRMKIELLCVIGEGSEIIKKLDDRERRLKSRGRKGQNRGEVDSLLSFLGGADNMLGGNGFEAKRSDYYSSDDDEVEEEGAGNDVSAHWDNKNNSTKEVPLTHFVPLESNVVKVKNPFVSTLTPLRSSAGEDELVRRILGKISAALSVDEDDEDSLLGEKVVDEEETEILEEKKNETGEEENQEQEEEKQKSSARVELWNKIVEEVGGNVRIQSRKNVDRLSEDEWADLILHAVRDCLHQNNNNNNNAEATTPLKTQTQTTTTSNALSPPEVTSFNEDDNPADKSTNRSMDEMLTDGFGDIFGVPTTPSKNFLEVVNPRAVLPDYAPPYFLTKAVYSCTGGGREEVVREWTKFLGNGAVDECRRVEKGQTEGEHFPHLSQMCCELLRAVVVQMVSGDEIEAAEQERLASFVETNVYYLAFVEDTCTDFSTRLLTACLNKFGGSDIVIESVMKRLSVMDSKHVKQVQDVQEKGIGAVAEAEAGLLLSVRLSLLQDQDSLGKIVADKSLVETVLVDAFPFIGGTWVKKLLVDNEAVFLEYCVGVLGGTKGEEGARDRGLVEAVCSCGEVVVSSREEVVRIIGGFGVNVGKGWWRKAIFKGLTSVKAWDGVEELGGKLLGVVEGVEGEAIAEANAEKIVVEAMQGLCDHKLDREDWSGFESAMKMMHDVAEGTDAIIEYLAHRHVKRTTTDDVHVFEKIVNIAATKILKPGRGLELLKLYTMTGGGLRSIINEILYKAADDSSCRDELSVAWDRLQRMNGGGG
ncbi:hypothetical protein TL16_g12197 [Triparma laevis f. inornata]|uniref:PDZ domain-containing protein n=1 Tax=Triparma laevis f. inornata TaxID=1714386 RepID=A0A9W7BK63_9STRA|nr:hypothetical protein TL16_g12197 [Triparma laevis f. inornata]